MLLSEQQEKRGLATCTFYTGVIITWANSKDGHPCGVRNVVTHRRISMFLAKSNHEAFTLGF